MVEILMIMLIISQTSKINKNQSSNKEVILPKIEVK